MRHPSACHSEREVYRDGGFSDAALSARHRDDVLDAVDGAALHRGRGALRGWRGPFDFNLDPGTPDIAAMVVLMSSTIFVTASSLADGTVRKTVTPA